MSVQQLTAELVHLGKAAAFRSTDSLSAGIDVGATWPRSREGRIVAELRRRRRALRRRGFV